ncbi:hypothetical protein Nepgr_006271 [Nepenthes gracilis]|uniref:RRM domain-containing protein n=1 Tax=Nepenthes gracilis TaxID=150966 RepID=A0AAD3S4P5_NEPGR|nr:hypothetical protein Nepgr_006271 [Nepenthes gracilis]
MESSVRVDDRTFRINFSGEGAAKLRERVKDKLKEFMGDYTDDTLVDYVIVLLRNGRRKNEAKNELDVFLGDDSNSFVTWLWDHLASNIDQYIQPHEFGPVEVLKVKPALVEHAARNVSQDLDAEAEREKSEKASRRRHNREWKGLARDGAQPPPFCSSEIDVVQKEGKTHQDIGHIRQPAPSEPPRQRKRSRPDERQPSKVVSRETMAAPRRLLQFAVRDAVTTSRPSNSTSVPALKRLRSVVSSSTVNSALEVRPQRLQSVARVPKAVAIAIKAVADAAEDVRRVRPTANAFDQLSHDIDAPESTGQVDKFRHPAREDEQCEDYDQNQVESHQRHLQRSVYDGEFIGSTTMMGSDSELASDSASDNEGYDGVNVMGHSIVDVSQTGLGGKKGGDSLMVQCNVAQNPDEAKQEAQIKDQDPPVSMANTSRKIVNISVNVNTWKPPHYQPPRKVELETQKSVQQRENVIGKSSVLLVKENRIPITVNGNGKPTVVTRNESQKSVISAPGSYSCGRPLEDADSRTIFVNNVNFAATKDSLSRHFNKFGEVLKVIILTDATTGQPKGSASVEFMRKEAAENALALDGTSFMSRILKVVRKRNALQEAAPIMTWPRIARGAPFTASRFGWAPFPKTFPVHMQDGQHTNPVQGACSGNGLLGQFQPTAQLSLHLATTIMLLLRPPVVSLTSEQSLEQMGILLVLHLDQYYSTA